jgi:hypothetical protein
MEGAGLCLEICSLEQKWENDESEIHWRAQLDFQCLAIKLLSRQLILGV